MATSTTRRRLQATDGPLRHPDRPDEILAAACSAIVQRGFHNTRVIDIARAADTSTGTIHYYFHRKQDVLSAALRWASEQLFDRVDRLDDGDTLTRLATLLALSIPQSRSDEYVLWMEMWTVVLHSPDELPGLERLSERWRTFFFDTIARGAASGEFTLRASVPTVAERIIAIVDGLGFETVVGYSWGTPERMFDLLVSFAADQLGLDEERLTQKMIEMENQR